MPFSQVPTFSILLTFQVLISYTNTPIQKSIHNFLSIVPSLSLLPPLFFFFSHMATWSRRMEAGDMVEASFESARIQKWGKKKTTRHGCIVNGIVHRTPCRCSLSAGVEALELHPCFLAFGVFEQRKRDIKINIWKPMFKKCCFITHSFERLYT